MRYNVGCWALRGSKRHVREEERSGKERRGETKRERPAVKYIRAAVRLCGAATNHADPRCYPPHGVGVVYPYARFARSVHLSRKHPWVTIQEPIAREVDSLRDEPILSLRTEINCTRKLRLSIQLYMSNIYISYNLHFVNHLQNLIILE